MVDRKMRLIPFSGPRIALKARFGPKGGPENSNGPNIGPVTVIGYRRENEFFDRHCKVVGCAIGS